MALPMQATAAHPSSIAASTPTPRGGFSAPGIRINDSGAEAINLDEFYSTMEQVPPVGATPATAVPAGAPEWMPAERPIIRPQSPGTAPLSRRASGQMPSQPRPPADELGVEESEFDKPAYLRRGLYAPE